MHFLRIIAIFSSLGVFLQALPLRDFRTKDLASDRFHDLAEIRITKGDGDDHNNDGTGGYLDFQFKNGQCTDWADARYFELTGHHIDWSGDASSWPRKARKSTGWVVSERPQVPSIIVIPPRAQGTGSPGHVAIVEEINSDGTVYTSNFNYNGGPYKKTFANFHTDDGVYFIWHE
ncbi:hypothetical protein K493DRAFT_295347 [Basidiobolus meristosporus CBS 931.73]|uniref:Peptidase C51 domain-containing protein n=1 Tax=Basidiobolus meristosporus CBS 931.73 TaxID=1314790 RepID=A0A1Y1ZBP9_9FUNG|nr:hypothetical protein K493DRAFT_295347 [Basidiobolus meristosporus CBS 931.73]|eukprot:ORY07711.1 hypothetical protein K493DRAFT_295347 [Basidiobolus meristosporus CBS 931.73]